MPYPGQWSGTPGFPSQSAPGILGPLAPPQQQGGGIDWGKILMGGGMLAGGVADLWGAHAQNQTNQNNYAAQMAQQAMINGLVGQYMTPANQQNPYASQMMNFLGMGQQPLAQRPNRPQGGQRPGIPSWVPGQGQGQGGLLGQMASEVGQPVGSNASETGGPFLQQGSMGIGQLMPQGQQPGQMYQYQNVNPASYQAAQMGAAPQVNAQQLAMPNPYQAQQVGAQPGVQAQQIQMPGQIDLPQVGAPDQVSLNTQGYNTGQDGLLQMMNKNISAPHDASIDPMLQAGTGQFDNSALFKSLAPQDKQILDEQVNQLRGSAGSFGQRFGSQMMKQEGNMRGQFANNVAARNAGIQQQSFEQAAGRNLQGAGIQTGREQFFGQQPFQNAQLQMQAAQGLQQGGLQQAGLGLQAQQFNVGQNQQAQQFNAQNAINASLASQGIAAQLGQANASNQLQAGQFNAQLGQQGQLANQQAALQAGMGGQNLLAQLMQGNQQYNMQGQLANQQMAGQYGLANQNAMNQMGQFNAQMGQQNQQFGAQQGNIYNQLMMSGMMNAGQMQNQQFGQNAQLLGILAGLGVPQQQVNPMYGAIGSAATTAGMLPMFAQMMGGR